MELYNTELNDDFDASAFTKSGHTQVSTNWILMLKGASVVTDHLAEFYELTGDKKSIESLKILDYSQFWKTSKLSGCSNGIIT